MILPLAALVAEDGRVNMPSIAQQLGQWPERHRPAERKPPHKRAKRAGEIAALTREIREHLRTARDYAETTLRQTGEATLLPRPTQDELGILG